MRRSRWRQRSKFRDQKQATKSTRSTKILFFVLLVLFVALPLSTWHIATGSFPLPLSSQNQLHNSPDAAMTAAGASHVRSTSRNFGHRVGNGDWESDSAENRQILDVVSDIADAIL